MKNVIGRLNDTERVESGDHAIAAAARIGTPESIVAAVAAFALLHEDLREKVVGRAAMRQRRRAARAASTEARAAVVATLRKVNAALLDDETGRHDEALRARVYDTFGKQSELEDIGDNGVFALHARAVADRAREAGVDSTLCDAVSAAADAAATAHAEAESAASDEVAAQDALEASRAAWDVAWKSFVWTVRAAVGKDHEQEYVLAHSSRDPTVSRASASPATEDEPEEDEPEEDEPEEDAASAEAPSPPVASDETESAA